jgi:hypothetical protein
MQSIQDQQNQVLNQGDDDKIQSPLTTGGPSYFAMDEAFRVRMLTAIEAGLENAPVGVITAPGTKSPKYLPIEPRPLGSSQGGIDF